MKIINRQIRLRYPSHRQIVHEIITRKYIIFHFFPSIINDFMRVDQKIQRECCWLSYFYFKSLLILIYLVRLLYVSLRFFSKRSFIPFDKKIFLLSDKIKCFVTMAHSNVQILTSR